MLVRKRTRLSIGLIVIALIAALLGLSQLYAGEWQMVFYLAAGLLLGGLLCGVAFAFILERGLLARVSRISSDANNVVAGADPSLRITAGGNDGLSPLVADMNGLLEAPEQSQRKLLASELRYRTRPVRRVPAALRAIVQRSEESAGAYRQLMEQASDGILVCFPGEKFLEANTAICKMLGHSTEELKSLRLDDIVAGQFSTGLLAMRDKVRAGAAALSELEVVRKDGTTFIAEISMNKLSDGRTQGIVRDVTERKLYERKMRENSASQAMLLRQLMTAQEAERRRLSMDIHDGPLQMLGVALMALDRASRRNDRGEKELTRQELENLRGMLAETVNEVRAVLADLSQDALTTYGLAAAIQNHLSRFEDATGMHVEFRSTLERRLLADLELLLYRLAQESLANVRKHSRAGKVQVTLDEMDGTIVLRVCDDGQGFLVEEAFERHEEGHGIGLRSMRERAQGAGGSFNIESSPGCGTTLDFTIPIPKKLTPFTTEKLEHLATVPL